MRVTAPPPLLTPILHTVLRRVTEGATLRHISRELGISEGTVRGYANRLRDALGADTLPQAVHYAHHYGLLEDVSGPPEMPSLTALEITLLRLMAGGRSNSAIARKAGLNEYQVADRIKRLRGKLGARDRTHAVTIAIALGLVDAEQASENTA